MGVMENHLHSLSFFLPATLHFINFTKQQFYYELISERESVTIYWKLLLTITHGSKVSIYCKLCEERRYKTTYHELFALALA